MNTETDADYDVLIMGAGIVGLCQARHLMLKIPGIRVALVDPRGTVQSDRTMKVGESLVEISAMFLYRELELHEYLIENHPPKYGLNFHWPKEVGKTETLDDYFHIWTNGNPDLPSYQINRAKFEADVLEMNIEMGVTFLQGKVVDTEISPGTAPNRAMVKSTEGEIEISAHHLIDAAGRKFLLGRKLDNLVMGKENLGGLDTGSAWVRVTGIDRNIFQKKREFLNGAASHYYGTNHFMGHGHWIWMIPIEKESRTISFGVVHHRSVIANDQLNSREKFLAFLKANHRVVFDMIESGEVLDFKYLPVIAHRSKKMISEDQWYVIGEAANMFDPFFSTALVLASQNIELVTETIRAKRSGEPDAEAKRADYDAYILAASMTYNQVYRDHEQHLGDPAAMSWRIYMESCFWFGILIPMFAGKWHLERDFIKQFFKLTDSFFFSKNAFVHAFYDELTAAQKAGKCHGMMDYTRTDLLGFGFNPLRIWDDFLENSKYGHRQLNALKGIKSTVFFVGLLYAKLRVKNSGWLGLLKPSTLRQLTKLAYWTVYTWMGEKVFLLQQRKDPLNHAEKEKRMEFMKRYRHQPHVAEWTVERDEIPANKTREVAQVE